MKGQNNTLKASHIQNRQRLSGAMGKKSYQNARIMKILGQSGMAQNNPLTFNSQIEIGEVRFTYYADELNLFYNQVPQHFYKLDSIDYTTGRCKAIIVDVKNKPLREESHSFGCGNMVEFELESWALLQK